MEKTIEEELRNEEVAGTENMEFENVVEEEVESPGIDILGILKAETGPGAADDEVYIQHPLNYNGSKGIARILRGITGMFGVSRSALADILVGSYQLFKE